MKMSHVCFASNRGDFCKRRRRSSLNIAFQFNQRSSKSICQRSINRIRHTEKERERHWPRELLVIFVVEDRCSFQRDENRLKKKTKKNNRTSDIDHRSTCRARREREGRKIPESMNEREGEEEKAMCVGGRGVFFKRSKILQSTSLPDRTCAIRFREKGKRIVADDDDDDDLR